MKFRRDFAIPACMPFFGYFFELSENMEYDRELWDNLIPDLVDSFVHPYDQELLRKADASAKIVMDRISAVLLKRRASPDDGFISKFAQACPDGEIACPAILIGICIAAYNAVHLHMQQHGYLTGSSSTNGQTTQRFLSDRRLHRGNDAIRRSTFGVIQDLPERYKITREIFTQARLRHSIPGISE